MADHRPGLFRQNTECYLLHVTRVTLKKVARYFRRFIQSGKSGRAGNEVEKRRVEVNEMVKTLCNEKGFIYVSNDNINLDDIDYDKVHLKETGSCKVANNLLHAINL